MASVAGDDQSLMELVQGYGGDLDRTIATELLERLFAALGEAHVAGIAWGGLSPESVRVASDGQTLRVKVLDSRSVEELWTAPEYGCEGYRPVPNADVWALGSLTFLVLTGAPYWRRVNERASMADRALQIQPATERAAELGVEEALPAGFDAWFARAVHHDPERRFANAAQAWQAIHPLLVGAAPSPGSARPSVVVRPGLFVTLVISSVVAAGLVIYWLLRSMHI